MFFIEISGVKVNDNISMLRMAGYCKALITLVKYMPQVYLNYKRKSTDGWSIENIILDLTGGTFSLLQQIIDSVARGKPFFGDDSFNIVKFMLSIMSIAFDIIFLIQHFIMYPHPKKNKQEKEYKEMLDQTQDNEVSFRI